MTVNTDTSTASYIGNGSTAVFTVPFYFLVDSDLLVTHKSAATGAITTMVLNSDYTVTGAGNEAGGSITTIPALPNGDTIFIERNVDAVQQTAYPPNSPFPAASHEQALDRLTMLIQQVLSKLTFGLFRDPLNNTYNAGGNTISNAADAVNPTDLTTQQQVDQKVAAGNSGIAPANIALVSDLASVASGKGASMVAFLQSGTGAVERGVQDRLLDTISVFDFMTAAQIADVRAGTLTQDVTAAVQAALNAAANKRLYFPPGYYKLSAALVASQSVYLAGAGAKATFLWFTLPASSTANLISFNASHTQTWYGAGIADLSIVDNTTTTGTTAVYVESVIYGLFANLNVSGSHNGYSFNGGLNKIVNNLIGDLGGTKSACVAVRCTGNGAGLGIYDTLVQSTTVVGQQIGVGYLFDGGASPTMHSASTYGCAIGCRITAAAASCIWPELVNCQFDTGQDTGLLIDTGTGGTIYGLACVNLWAGTNTNYGVHIIPNTGTINGLNFTGGRIYNNGLSGFFVEGGANLSVCDMHISGNGSSTHAGMYVSGAVSGLAITGNRIGQLANFANTQTYGIQLGAVAISGAISGNDLTGNITDGLFNGSTTPLAIAVNGNTGYSQNALIAPTLLNSWANNGAPSGNCYYYRDSSNVVHVQGLIKNGTLASPAFTLPAGFRPAGDQYFSCIANGAVAVAYVQASTGNVIPQSGSNVYFSLCGISFKAEQ